MAERPIFIPTPAAGLVEERSVEFEFFNGFSLAQKQRSIESLHEAAQTAPDINQILEVSTKSTNSNGVQLSAFNLSLSIESEPRPVLLEAAYQGSKVFGNQGPFTYIYKVRDGREIKKIMRQYEGLSLTSFRWGTQDWELEPKTAFYDWLYLNALQELAFEEIELDALLFNFNAFTDIEFNPKRSVNCQARSCALYVALLKLNILSDALADPSSFITTLTQHGYGVAQGKLL
tara:strand:+ start:1310 stop:2005 length:696 start_codon:yes stop_codon:yes gene_type:complete